MTTGHPMTQPPMTHDNEIAASPGSPARSGCCLSVAWRAPAARHLRLCLALGAGDLAALAAGLPGPAAGPCPDRRTLGQRRSGPGCSWASQPCRCCCPRSCRCCCCCRTSIRGHDPARTWTTASTLTCHSAAARWIFYLIVWFGVGGIALCACAANAGLTRLAPPGSDPARPDHQLRCHRRADVA